MAFDIKGTVHPVRDTQQVSEKFSKRPFVVEVADGKYPQLIEFEATGDRCLLLDNVRQGDTVKVTFNVRGRKWSKPGGEEKFFVSLDVWKLDVESKAAGSTYNAGPNDDIPF